MVTQSRSPGVVVDVGGTPSRGFIVAMNDAKVDAETRGARQVWERLVEVCGGKDQDLSILACESHSPGCVQVGNGRRMDRSRRSAVALPADVLDPRVVVVICGGVCGRSGEEVGKEGEGLGLVNLMQRDPEVDLRLVIRIPSVAMSIVGRRRRRNLVTAMEYSTQPRDVERKLLGSEIERREHVSGSFQEATFAGKAMTDGGESALHFIAFNLELPSADVVRRPEIHHEGVVDFGDEL